MAFQTCGPHPADEEEERSSRLKALLKDYFEKEPGGEQAARGCEEEEEEDLSNAKVSKSALFWELLQAPTVGRYSRYAASPV